MSFYCHQVSYTTDARKRLLNDPHNRYEAIREPIEKLGGHLKSSFFTLGPFDVLVISEFPQDISLADLSIAFSHGGAIASIHTYPLLPLPETSDHNSELKSEPDAPRTRVRSSAAFAATSGQ